LGYVHPCCNLRDARPIRSSVMNNKNLFNSMKLMFSLYSKFNMQTNDKQKTV
jgi:hypothetical protein